VSDWRSRLEAGAAEILHRSLTTGEIDQFAKYLELLVSWQRVQRLLGSVEPVWVVEEVFLDSLLFGKLLPPTARNILDFGSGAGLPGIPIKIVRPEMRLTLLESRQRRASFLRAVVRGLGLENTTVLDVRAETLLGQEAHRYDAVVMRCAGHLSSTMPMAAGLAAPGGVVIAAGSPRETEAPRMGTWAVVPGTGQRRSRRFAVHRVPPGGAHT
jgi:16S rRNA (guanine527-N7)-methyltransferase